ncbi:uncharacterized protein RJT20DRAFT_125796 [Scheffersomyces xylosifermentans]|uniref:uncharacterized protein n=1 Tax=Scheffersomyces xylosifermentans TaxID=1304137 RepID=UPI00315DAFF4
MSQLDINVGRGDVGRLLNRFAGEDYASGSSNHVVCGGDECQEYCCNPISPVNTTKHLEPLEVVQPLLNMTLQVSEMPPTKSLPPFDRLPPTIMCLPAELVARILFFVFIITECTLKDVKSFITTSRYFYFQFRFMLFSLKPIHFNEYSLGDSSCLNFSHIRSIVKSPMICSWIKDIIVVSREKGVITRRPSSKVASSVIQSLLRTPRPESFQNLFLHNFDRFTSLESLTIGTNSFHWLRYLCSETPVTLKRLTIIIENYKLSNFNIKINDQIERMINTIDECKFKLESFSISSNKAIVQSFVHVMFCLKLQSSLANPQDFIQAYFNKQYVKTFEHYEASRRMGLLWFGYLLYKILDNSRETLTSLVFERIDMALIFNSWFPVQYNYKFPKLRYLLIDNVSHVRLNQWIGQMELANSTLRDNFKHMHVLLNDTIHQALLVKEFTHFENGNVPGSKPWILKKNAPRALQKYLQELQTSP